MKGYQVAPAELEAVLLEHRDVADAAVIGVPVRGDERPRAYVVLKEGRTTTTPQEVKKWMDARVARYKRLEGGVVFVESVPKNPVSYLRGFLGFFPFRALQLKEILEGCILILSKYSQARSSASSSASARKSKSVIRRLGARDCRLSSFMGTDGVGIGKVVEGVEW